MSYITHNYGVIEILPQRLLINLKFYLKLQPRKVQSTSLLSQCRIIIRDSRKIKKNDWIPINLNLFMYTYSFPAEMLEIHTILIIKLAFSINFQNS